MVIGIILAVLAFGVLIFIHELGHFIFARIFKVGVYEFAIGMGPKVFSKKSSKTGIVYSFRILPIGGFVAMEGEDEESDSESAFCNKPVWQRMIITAAGAFVNIVAGVVAMLLIVTVTAEMQGTTINRFGTFASEDVVYSSTADAGLQVGDRIIKVGDTDVHIYDDMRYEIMMNGAQPVDITVERDGSVVVVEDVTFSRIEVKGITAGLCDFDTSRDRYTFGNIVKHSFWRPVYMMRSIFDSLSGLVTGHYGIESVSGPVGIGSQMAQVASVDYTAFAELAVLISINLGIMNLLPLPALDGGRLLFQFIELVRGRPVSRKMEGYIHFGGIVVLMLFMLAITFKDVFTLIP